MAARRSGAIADRSGCVDQTTARIAPATQRLRQLVRTLEALVKSGYPEGPYQLPESLRGWRRELMGQKLLDSLATAGEQP